MPELGQKIWVDQKYRDRLTALYDKFCESCDIECPTFETWLVMLVKVAHRNLAVFDVGLDEIAEIVDESRDTFCNRTVV